ncbi:hypothetical protein BD779DRAFT_1554533 [Infundibulicybe gibba]|nr:hypothetical protein BD779DRAFT_1554533 [Infundibulicybe gibba]
MRTLWMIVRSPSRIHHPKQLAFDRFPSPVPHPSFESPSFVRSGLSSPLWGI